MKKTQDYRVGYACPPKQHQFRPGQSGNPAGRPKGARNIKTELVEELSELVTVEDGNKIVEVSKSRAVIKTLLRLAIAGDARAIATVMGSCARALGNDSADDEVEAPEDREIVRAVAKPPKRRTVPDDSSPSNQESV
jgi:hypothetical protein